ncbi:MAG: helix-turn-helix transcriptional regulator [Euryarchaeota archaeon]|nr:helix-turn-helix transcriptional regulator [Euryarchaeota archaeon]MBT6844232.1 helix-turn-helix transcriptional regulator [Euryarchaeota archaeon]
MSGERIRSGHQRRVLNWLMDGGGTVSEIAESLQLRMPHASLALRQLRERGEVSREEQGSIRGAIHRLNDIGRRRLASDAVARIRTFVNDIPSQAEAIVLGQDGPHLLLGYVKPPRSRLLPLPNQGISDEKKTAPFSNGSKGGRWAVQRDENIRWYTLSKLEPSDAPAPQNLRGTLGEWTEEVDRIGIVHATLLDSSHEWPLSPGTWYIETENHSPLPNTLVQGENILGTVTGTGISLSPKLGVHAHLTLSVNRVMALNALRKNAFVFEERPQQQTSRFLPHEALHPWLRNRHPRLSAEKLLQKYEELRVELLTPEGGAPPIALQRQLLADFGVVEWKSRDIITTINFSGVSNAGALALLEWFLHNSTQECVVEWPYPIEENRRMLERILSSGRCRILITSNGNYRTLESATSVLQTRKTLMKAAIIISRDKSLPISLLQSNPVFSQQNSHEEVPLNASELLEAWGNSDELRRDIFTGIETNTVEQKAMWYALSNYPEGDEKWANLNESKHPLAAWIATPNQHRTSRWIRLRAILPQGWADLLPIELCETATLISAMPKGSEQWSKEALEKTRQRFTKNIESILKYEYFFQDDVLGPWMATAVLLSTEQLPEEFHQLLEQACTLWVDAPHQPERVLESLFPLGNPLSTHVEECLIKCKAAAKIHPKGSVLYLWGSLLENMESNEPISPEFLRQIMSKLPSTWWRTWAGDWLQVQLSSTSGRRWLAKTPFPWPALLTRPAGERGGLPAWPIPYPSGRVGLDDVLHILLIEENEGKSALLDVYDMLATYERQEPVHYGRTHPLVGWLARSVESWPHMGLDVLRQGNPEIGALLYARYFASKLE